jgi:glycosidase
VLKQKSVQDGSAAYHGYWGLDFTTVDPHLGSDADYAAFVDCAHRLGMKVILDVVVNHTADVVKLAGSEYNPAAYRDCRGRRFDPAAYVTAKHFPCVSRRNMPWFPTVPSADAGAKKPAWLNDPLRYHDRGDIDFSNCSQRCYEQGDFFGLDDLFTEQPVVMKGLAAIYGGWIRRFKVDGFRVDTARHVNAAFFRLWVPRILASAKAAGVGGFQIFGEVPLTDDVELSAYVRDRGLPNVLDFPFQQDAVGYAGGASSPRAVATRLADDDYFLGPSGIAATPATFLGNHDLGRAALQVANASHASGQELVDRLLLGYDLMYLLRGAPVVLYGDEVGMIGRGGDQQARQDLFPTQVDEWKTQERAGSPPIGNGSSFAVQGNPIQARLRELGALRGANPALSTGSSIVRLASGNVLAVSRSRPGGAARAARRLQLRRLRGASDRDDGYALLGLDAAPWDGLGHDERLRRLGDGDRAGARRRAVPGRVPDPGPGSFAAGAEGRPRRLQLALARGRDRRRPAGERRLRRPPRRRRLAAARGRRLVAVPARSSSPRALRRNERIQLVAVARSLDGRVAVSKVVPFRVRP